ncbi:hypothetical protein [Kangiella sp. HZ709]|uniref:hypothetical protein n=1 Tax=Kangiella sp. HZ709 TaxID=2666328 RepID=UPI0012B143F4|nr:hypothetical protein [Kangiella sp. HZ709]MRX27512.1 hypothetical protein [Kangiella sp. HZ709]
MSERKIYFKILMAICLSMLVVVVGFRGFTKIMGVGSDTLMGRVDQARNALPEIIKEEKDLVMMFGSSMVRAGFSPRQFDREMKNAGVLVKSYNFGFGGLNPYFQDVLATRIKEQFDAGNKRLKLTIIEFNPFQTTTTRRNGAIALEESFLGLLGTDEELLNIAKSDLRKGIRMANIKYLRDGISAEMVTSFYGRMFAEPRPRTDLPRDSEEHQKRLQEVGEALNKKFDEEYPNFVDSQWSMDWQGGGTIPEERSEETLKLFDEYYALLQSDHRMDNARLNRVHTADIEELNFDPLLMDSFINLVKTFQQFSDQVEVVILPQNRKWIKNPPEAIARFDRAVEKIQNETKAKVRNFDRSGRYDYTMFSDATHLARYLGDVPFTNHLIEVYEPILRRD